jgi:hypothetical protein
VVEVDLAQWSRAEPRKLRSAAQAGQCFYGETDCCFREFKPFQGRNSSFVSIDNDYRAQAQAAMQWAVAATCERERLSWVRVALAWQDLDRGDEDAAISIASMHSLSFAGN